MGSDAHQHCPGGCGIRRGDGAGVVRSDQRQIRRRQLEEDAQAERERLIPEVEEGEEY